MINTNVTIIGQPEITDWFVALQVKCPCGKTIQLVGQPGAMRACGGTTPDGKCGKIYRVSGLPVLQENGTPGLAPVVMAADGLTFATGLAFGTIPQQ